MINKKARRINKFYLSTVLLLMLVLPVVSILIDRHYQPNGSLIALTGKWFVFWAIGMRLFTAGIRQVAKPAFTLQQIFHIQSTGAQAVVKELGFANICFGLAAILSLFIPGWRPAAAFAGGLYLGIAGINHLIKKPASLNEVIAMISDLFVFVVIGVYLYGCFFK